jgi:PTH1 family peptidyl-tRNA hydrolase
MVVDELLRRHGAEGYRLKFSSLLAEARYDDEKLVLLKPQTYMNLSGRAVREAVNWYHVPLDQLLVIQDDMDLPFGRLRLRTRGSAGGHNGIGSIIQQLGTQEFPRLKVGIGRGRQPAEKYVLERFSPDQEQELPFVINAAADAAELWVREGAEAAMNLINAKPEAAAGPA